MKIERLVFWCRIAGLPVILIAVVATYAITNGVKNSENDLARDTMSVVEDSTAGGHIQSQRTISESVSAPAGPSENLPGEGTKDTVPATAADPLENALKKGLPVVADFGRSTCIPCKMMLPILEKLEHELEGKASVLIIDIREYSTLSRKYKITLIPTQIFFDANGEEVFRHQGFMPEEEIILQLKEMGVD
ncbi:MAG: thioredoxin family protein [candidate division WOR-3 bacterium]|nr:MAG: thioredoxin family protein [candidate division WOR-3 bacterium]